MELTVVCSAVTRRWCTPNPGDLFSHGSLLLVPYADNVRYVNVMVTICHAWYGFSAHIPAMPLLIR
jgi:hypothetical protein